MGQGRSQPDVKKNTKSGQYKDLSFAVSSMCGWRMYMEDADIAETPLRETEFSLFGVFDGHGGIFLFKKGPEVSAFVKKHFSEELYASKNFKQRNYGEALRQNFLKMDQLMLTEKGQQELSQIHKQMAGKNNADAEYHNIAGCTGNVVLITPEYIYCANAGDSRAVACASGKVQPLSFDHKPEDQVQIARIEKAGGQVTWGRVNGNLNLTRAIGDFQYKKHPNFSPQQQIITANPDIKTIKNEGLDFIIMGCDGIWQVKSNGEMVEWIQKRLQDNKQLPKIVQQLLDELVSKEGSGSQYGMDNMSSILVTFRK